MVVERRLVDIKALDYVETIREGADPSSDKRLQCGQIIDGAMSLTIESNVESPTWFNARTVMAVLLATLPSESITLISKVPLLG